MKYWTRGKRMAAVLLALAMLLSIVPNRSIPVHSEQAQPQNVDYSQFVGYLAEIIGQDLKISADPAADDQTQTLSEAEFDRGCMLQIVDYALTQDRDLWYKVVAAPGYTLPAKLEACPWIFQNRVSTYQYRDALRLRKPAGAQVMSSAVSDAGVTVSSPAVTLESLKATQVIMDLKDTLLADNVIYTLALKTANGSYNGYAMVTIPVPEKWNRENVVGFVIDHNGEPVVIPGCMTEYGTFRFTAPHCDTVGIAQIEDLSDVKDYTIAMDHIQGTCSVSIPGVKMGQAGHYTTEDGAAAYEIQHTTTTAIDGKRLVSTSLTVTGLLPTTKTVLEIDGYRFTILVHTGTAQAEKLLTGGQTLMLYPLYDLGITGTYAVTYDVTEGAAAIYCTDGAVSLRSGFAGVGTATIVATVRGDQNTVLATVTYTVTLSSLEAHCVKTLKVAMGETVTIEGFDGTLVTDQLLQPEIAAVAQEEQKLTITGAAESGKTYFLAEANGQKVLFEICAQPQNGGDQSRRYAWIAVDARPGTMVYYALQDEQLHPLPMESGHPQILLFAMGAEDSKVIFFCAPAEGYITAAGSSYDIYWLSDSEKPDGTDTDAWPYGKKAHGLSGVDTDMLRNLFTKALTLGCDSVTGITLGQKNQLTFQVEKLPELQMVMTHYWTGSYWQEYTDGTTLQIGARVRYQFSAVIEGENTAYDLTITAPTLTANGDMLSVSGEWQLGQLQIGEYSVGDFYVGSGEVVIPPQNPDGESGKEPEMTVTSRSSEYVHLIFHNIRRSLSFTLEYTLNAKDVTNYAQGQFVNRATMDLAYTAQVASGVAQSEATHTVPVKSIVTWMDSFGTILEVEYTSTTTIYPYPAVTPPLNFAFDGWYLGDQKLEGEKFTYDGQSGQSVTIVAKLVPTQYTIILNLDDGKVPMTIPYGYGDTVELPQPKRAGYEFLGWKVTANNGQTHNWPEQIDCTDIYTLTDVYGNVTLTAQWSYTTLTIEVAGCHAVDAGQTFLFTIADDTGWQMEVFVTVQEDGKGQVTIEGLDGGKTYVITQQAWSWRYKAEEPEIEIELFGNAQNVVTFTQQRVQDKWLDSNAQN